MSTTSAAGEAEQGAGRPKLYRSRSSASTSRANAGYTNGHVRSPSEAQHIQDAEAFELQGLISDEENETGEAANETHPLGPKKPADEENPLIAKEASRS